MDSPGQRVGLYGVRRNGRLIFSFGHPGPTGASRAEADRATRPAPGDWLDDGPSVTGGFAGKLTVSVNRSQIVDEPGERNIIANRH